MGSVEHMAQKRRVPEAGDSARTERAPFSSRRKLAGLLAGARDEVKEKRQWFRLSVDPVIFYLELKEIDLSKGDVGGTNILHLLSHILFKLHHTTDL